jgi:hypothetical protein
MHPRRHRLTPWEILAIAGLLLLIGSSLLPS